MDGEAGERRKGNKILNLWNGIYSSFSAVDIECDYAVGDSKEWVKSQIDKVENNFIELFEGQNKLLNAYSRKFIYPKIVDFGGSIGHSYLAIDNEVVNYYVIETKEICKAGKEFYKDDPSITFLSSMPKLKDVDIVYIRSALQYAKSPVWILGKLIDLDPRYFIFSHLSAGNIDSFVSLQEWYGHKIPYWFLDLSQIRRLFDDCGYELEMQSSYEDLDQSNFPVENKILHTKNLVFKRIR